MKAKKLPSGRWRVQVYLGKDAAGKKIMRSVTADTKAEAEYEAAQIRHEADRYMSQDCTIADAIDKYINNRASVSSPSTIQAYRQHQRYYYGPINDYSVRSITSEDIQKFVNDLSKNLSPKSVRNIYGLLHSSITATAPDKTIRVQLPQKQIVKRTVPVDDQIQALIENADPQMKIAITLAAVGTLRRGEICGLEYGDIKDNFIHVQRVVVLNEHREFVTKNIPKTNTSDRWVEFPPQVIEMIGTGEGRIITVNPNTITSKFCKLRNKLGYDFRFHDLRHYAASIMHALGVPDEYIMERGGWSSDATLKAVYRDILEDKKNEFTAKTNDYMTKFLQ